MSGFVVRGLLQEVPYGKGGKLTVGGWLLCCVCMHVCIFVEKAVSVPLSLCMLCVCVCICGGCMRVCVCVLAALLCVYACMCGFAYLVFVYVPCVFCMYLPC